MLVGIKAAEPNNQLSAFKKEQNQEQLIYNTVSAYFQVLIIKEQEKLTLENEKKYKDLLEILALRLEKGVIKKTEYDRTKASLNNIVAQKSILQVNKQIALNRLKNAIGMPVTEDVVDVESLNYEGMALVEKENGFEIGNLLDLKIQNANASLLSFDVKRKEAAFLPTVSMYARYGGQSFGNEFGLHLVNGLISRQWFKSKHPNV
jgi:outer membrane protein TolC